VYESLRVLLMEGVSKREETLGTALYSLLQRLTSPDRTEKRAQVQACPSHP
jgi:hypothetical protein